MIEDTTARAFKALLHFLYSDMLEVEDEFLIDVLRCFLACLCLLPSMKRHAAMQTGGSVPSLPTVSIVPCTDEGGSWPRTCMPLAS